MVKMTARGLFVPSWWSWLLAFAFGLWVATALGGCPTVPWIQNKPLLVLMGVGTLIGAWFLAALLWLFSDGARMLFQFVFLGLWGSFALGALAVARDYQLQADRAIVEKINSARLALRQQAIERAKQALDERIAREDRIKEDRFARYEAEVDEVTLGRMRALDAEIVAELTTAAEKYEAVLAANDIEGPSAWLRVATIDELEVSRSRNQAIYEASRAYNDFLDGLEERYNTRVEALALDPPADRFAIAEMERLLQFWEHSGARDFRRLDSEICGIALQALDLLRQHWGEWRFDRADSRVVFQNPSVEFQFFQLLNEAEMLVREQTRIERQLKREEAK